MNKYTPLIVAALLASLFAGCSKHSPVATSLKATNLGVVEISSGTQIRHDLGGGNVCVITPTVITKGNAKFVNMLMVIEQADASGILQTQAGLAGVWVHAKDGEAMEWLVTDMGISICLTP